MILSFNELTRINAKYLPETFFQNNNLWHSRFSGLTTREGGLEHIFRDDTC